MKPRVNLRNYLPALFRAAEVNNVSFLSRFLNAFELLFEGLEAQIEGDRDPDTGAITGGGIPDLFDVASTPPSQFVYRAQSSSDNADPDFDFLTYLASWIGLALRINTVRRSSDTDASYDTDRTSLNRQFILIAIKYYPQRGTLIALDAMLRAWLGGELFSDPPLFPILTDLRPQHTDGTAVFQLGVAPPQSGANLGFDTVLGRGPSYLFVADLTVDPAEPAFRAPSGLDTFQRSTRLLLDSEKPAHTDYQLRVRSHTMQLAEAGETNINGLPAAQVGVTSLLWSAPWVFNSE